MPQFVKLEEIKAGMVLSEPVQNNFGQVMIPKDFTIEEKHLRLLKLWNVVGIIIKLDDDDTKVELTPEQIKKYRDRLESRMTWKAENSIENNLFSSAVKHLAENGR